MGQYESGVDSPQSERNADIGTNIAGDEADGKMDGRPDGWREAGRQPATKKKERKKERKKMGGGGVDGCNPAEVEIYQDQFKGCHGGCKVSV